MARTVSHLNLRRNVVYEDDEGASISSATKVLDEKLTDVREKLDEAKLYVSAAKEYLESLKGVIENLQDFIGMAEIDVSTAEECIMESKRRVKNLKSEMNFKFGASPNLETCTTCSNQSSKITSLNNTLDEDISSHVLEMVRKHINESEVNLDEYETVQCKKYDSVTVIVVKPKTTNSRNLELQSNDFMYGSKDSLDVDVRSKTSKSKNLEFENNNLMYGSKDSLDVDVRTMTSKTKNSKFGTNESIYGSKDSLETADITLDFDIDSLSYSVNCEDDSNIEAAKNYNALKYHDFRDKPVDYSETRLKQIFSADINSEERSINSGISPSEYDATNFDDLHTSEVVPKKLSDIENFKHANQFADNHLPEIEDRMLSKNCLDTELFINKPNEVAKEFCPSSVSCFIPNSDASNVDDAENRQHKARVEYIKSLQSKKRGKTLSNMLSSLKEKSMKIMESLLGENGKSYDGKFVNLSIFSSNSKDVESLFSQDIITKTYAATDISAVDCKNSLEETELNTKHTSSVEKINPTVNECLSQPEIAVFGNKDYLCSKDSKLAWESSEVSINKSLGDNSYITVSEATTTDTSINDDSTYPILKEDSSGTSVYEIMSETSRLLHSNTSSEKNSSETFSSEASSDVSRTENVNDSSSDMCLSGSCMTESRVDSSSPPITDSSFNENCSSSYQLQTSGSSYNEITRSLLGDFSNVSIISDFSRLCHEDVSYTSFKEGVSSSSLCIPCESLNRDKSDLLIDFKESIDPINENREFESNLSVEIHKSLISTPYPKSKECNLSMLSKLKLSCASTEILPQVDSSKSNVINIEDILGTALKHNIEARGTTVSIDTSPRISSKDATSSNYLQDETTNVSTTQNISTAPNAGSDKVPTGTESPNIAENILL